MKYQTTKLLVFTIVSISLSFILVNSINIQATDCYAWGSPGAAGGCERKGQVL